MIIQFLIFPRSYFPLDTNLGGFTPVIDETGKITGYKTTIGGADSVFPFSSGFENFDELYNFYSSSYGAIQSFNKTIITEKKYSAVVVLTVGASSNGGYYLNHTNSLTSMVDITDTRFCDNYAMCNHSLQIATSVDSGTEFTVTGSQDSNQRSMLKCLVLGLY